MKPKGIQLHRTKGWRMPEGAISVARPSRWGNLFVVGEGEMKYVGPQHGATAGRYSGRTTAWADNSVGRGLTAQDAVDLYRREIEFVLREAARKRHGWDTDGPYYREIVEALELLRGHDLGCFCGLDQPCHRDVLLEVANR